MSKGKYIFIFILALFLGINVKMVKADSLYNNISNVDLEGNAKGIVFLSGEEPFLCAHNMLPGDKVERAINIKNKHNVSYELYMKAERATSKEENDLLEKLNLTVTYEDKVLYKGPVSSKDWLSNNVYLGTINPNEFKKLNAEVVLDGSATGNEYKNRFAKVNWIFTAVNKAGEDVDKTPSNNNGGNNPAEDGGSNTIEDVKNNIIDQSKKLPQTGQDIVLIYLPLAIISLVVGIILVKKGGKHSGKKNS